MLWVLRQPYQRDGSFEHQKRMFKSPPKRILLVLKRTISVRKTNVKTEG